MPPLHRELIAETQINKPLARADRSAQFHRLRVWMDNQRINYHRGWLSAERIRRLEKVTFPWVGDRGRQVAARVN